MPPISKSIAKDTITSKETLKVVLSDELIARKRAGLAGSKTKRSKRRQGIWDKFAQEGRLVAGAFFTKADLVAAGGNKCKFDCIESLPLSLLNLGLAPLSLDGGAWLIPIEAAYARIPQATERIQLKATKPSEWEMHRIARSESELRQWLGTSTSFWQDCYKSLDTPQSWESATMRADLGWLAAGDLVRNEVNNAGYQPDICVRLANSNKLIVGEHKRRDTFGPAQNFALRQVFFPAIAESLALQEMCETTELHSIFLMSLDARNHLLVELEFELANIGRYHIKRAVEISIDWE